MPAVDLTPYNQPQGSTSDGTKYVNALALIQSTLNGLDNNNFAAGKIFDPSKLMQNSAVDGDGLAYDSVSGTWKRTTDKALRIAALAGYPADATKALFGDGTWKVPSAGSGVGAQLDRATITTPNVAVSATTEGTAVVQITGNAIVYDGTEVKLEFYCPKVTVTTGATSTTFVWLRDSTVIGQWTVFNSAAGALQDAYGTTFDTPAAGTHTYKIAAFVSANTATINAGNGTSGNLTAAFLRAIKA